MKLIAAAVIACAALVIPASHAGEEEDTVIPYALAGDFLGTEMCVEGVVKETHLSEGSGNLYLNFGDYRKDLSVQIPKESLANFPGNAETWYKGKKVRATGVIKRERGFIRLTVSDMAHLKVME